jgi:hydrogenase maturation protein HypF
MISETCNRLREGFSINRVALSGGCFQNTYLLSRSIERLTGEGFEVFCHQQIPPNDGGLALGQALIANEQLTTGKD